MALPLLNTQTFELNVPSTDEKIKYRPFLVKEEKILLQAQEGDDTEMIDALMTIIENCTFGKIQPHKYPSFDMEYIFLKIRSKAVGEKVSLNLTCPDDNETKVQHTVDLSKVEVEVEDGHTNKIALTDNVSIDGGQTFVDHGEVVSVTNPKTKKKGKVTLEGMQSFF